MGFKKFEIEVEKQVGLKEKATKAIVEGLDELGVREYAETHSGFDLAFDYAFNEFGFEDFMNLITAIFARERE